VLARCHVTRARRSVALAQKISLTETSLLCHRQMPRRSFSQTGNKLASRRVHRAQGFDRDGRKEVLASNTGIFSSLREAASWAAAPASRAYRVTHDSARGHMTVTSQHKDLPICHVMERV